MAKHRDAKGRFIKKKRTGRRLVRPRRKMQDVDVRIDDVQFFVPRGSKVFVRRMPRR